MNNLSNGAATSSLAEQQQHRHCYNCKPIPPLAIYILLPLFFIGLVFSIFILAVVHNALFLVILLSLSSLIAAFLLWNNLNSRTNASLLLYLRSFPDSDLRYARDGDIVKITGLVSCGSLSLESSYEEVPRCIYTSTLLFEFGELGLKPADVDRSCFQWRLAYSERFSTDFNITDRKSGTRALVKAGSDCKVIPLIVESRLVNTTRKCKTLSTNLRKWLTDRNLPAETRLLRLEEGYIKEGSCVSVIGTLRRNGEVAMIVEPPELSTGCLWRKLLLPVDIDGLILGVPEIEDTVNYPNSVQRLGQ
ncbi:hypothetical protein LguiB_023801 [Lonicera macranthoides]